MHGRAFIAGCALLAVLTLPASAAEVPAEAFQGWDRLAESYRRVQSKHHFKKIISQRLWKEHYGQGSHEAFQDSGITWRIVEDFVIAWYRNGDMHRWDATTRTANGDVVTDTISARGTKYGFEATRSKEGPYTLTSFRHGPRRADQPARLLYELKCPHSVNNVDVRSLFRDPLCTVRGITSRAEGEKQIARVDFTYAEGGEFAQRLLSGWIDFLTDRNWAVHGYLIKKPGGFYERFAAEYDSPVDGFLPIKQLRTEFLRGPTAVCEFYETSTFSECMPANLPERMFSLSAVGLPEAGRGTLVRRVFGAFLVAGLICLFVAIWMRFKVGRQAA